MSAEGMMASTAVVPAARLIQPIPFTATKELIELHHQRHSLPAGSELMSGDVGEGLAFYLGYRSRTPY